MAISTFQLATAAPGLDSDSAQSIASHTLAVWDALEHTLVPLIGDKGFAILFERCTYLLGLSHPRLQLPAPAAGVRPLDQLAEHLRQSAPADALAAANALFAIFRHALAALIGDGLAATILIDIPGFRPSSTQEVSS